MTNTAAAYDAAFTNDLANRFKNVNGWEVRQESPPGAYIHVSKPNWLDDHLNGIHLETYVMKSQIEKGYAPVCLHCEGGFPKQREFMDKFIERAKSQIDEWPGYKILGPKGGSVCEIWVPLGSTVDETMDVLANEIIRLQTLAPLIDQTIADVLSSK